MGLFTLSLSERDAQMLLGNLEDMAEFMYPPIEKNGRGIQEMSRDELDEVLAEYIGKSAAPVEVMSQKRPSLARLVVALYDQYGWPDAFDLPRQEQTRKLVEQSLQEERDEYDEETREQ